MSSTFHEIKTKAELVRAIDLREVLKIAGAVQDKYDREKWHTSQGVISVSGTRFMNWNKGCGGGGAIDLIIHLNNLDFKTALLWLSDNFPFTRIETSAENKSVPKQTLQLPVRDDTKLPQIINYLIQERCIESSLIKSLAHSGKLYADTRGNAVFLLFGKEGRPVGAELRGTTHLRWRGMAPGSRKDLGFFYLKALPTRKIVLCESAIDAISCFVLHPNCLTISTSGVNPNPAWLKSFINKGYEIYCGFDSDETGNKTATKMMALYPPVKRLQPCKHDWNEVLISKAKVS